MTMQKSVYTAEQIKRLSEVHRVLCAEQQIEPSSREGRSMAELLLDKCTGDEPAGVIMRRISH
ncbi:hypothetical protein ABID21_004598 [Pseudorhizobium tarimense]|uniref:Transposase n=1 Tax=Pseudorhizobium tarimense TaxID=1079109 RepID=A0ABV2HD36_9HYPH|nr:hypothetical protein [Pseudorhizobium tarimense]MCJ8521464.1 hypothetical protein [Pseudorhizobium tarimense]